MTAARRGLAIGLAVLGACSVPAALAQTSPGGTPGLETIESEPLRCWAKSTKTSVHVGEQFDVALTCAVVETARVTVVPDVSQIEPASIQLAPFEVLGGRRHPDIKRGLWRYFQYEYSVRLVADGFFGEDLAVPPISLSYRVNMLGGGAAQEGREKTYVLPQLPIRVVSLVPTIATDIRDAPHDTFARIGERRLAANAAFVAAGVLYAFAAAVAVTMLLRAFGGGRRRTTGRERALSGSGVAAAALGALRGIDRRRARDDWSPELVTRALAVARIAGALAVERPIAQAPAAPDAVPEDGQLLVVRGLLRRQPILLSASLTPRALEAGAARPAWPSRREHAAEIAAALAAFSEARYARTGTADAATLDAALGRVRSSLQRSRIVNARPVRLLGSVVAWWQSQGAWRWAR